MTVTWNGTDITGIPTLIYYDEVKVVMYSPPPTLSNPNGPGGLLCNSTSPSIAWWIRNGSTTIEFATNKSMRIFYQIIPSGNLMAQFVRDGSNLTSNGHDGLLTCRQNGDISTAVPVGFYTRGEFFVLIIIMHYVAVYQLWWLNFQTRPFTARRRLVVIVKNGSCCLWEKIY